MLDSASFFTRGAIWGFESQVRVADLDLLERKLLQIDFDDLSCLVALYGFIREEVVEPVEALSTYARFLAELGPADLLALQEAVQQVWHGLKADLLGDRHKVLVFAAGTAFGELLAEELVIALIRGWPPWFSELPEIIKSRVDWTEVSVMKALLAGMLLLVDLIASIFTGGTSLALTAARFTARAFRYGFRLVRNGLDILMRLARLVGRLIPPRLRQRLSSILGRLGRLLRPRGARRRSSPAPRPAPGGATRAAPTDQSPTAQQPRPGSGQQRRAERRRQQRLNDPNRRRAVGWRGFLKSEGERRNADAAAAISRRRVVLLWDNDSELGELRGLVRRRSDEVGLTSEELEGVITTRRAAMRGDGLDSSKYPELLIGNKVYESKVLGASGAVPSSPTHGGISFRPSSVYQNVSDSVRKRQAVRFLINADSVEGVDGPTMVRQFQNWSRNHPDSPGRGRDYFGIDGLREVYLVKDGAIYQLHPWPSNPGQPLTSLG